MVYLKKRKEKELCKASFESFTCCDATQNKKYKIQKEEKEQTADKLTKVFFKKNGFFIIIIIFLILLTDFHFLPKIPNIRRFLVLAEIFKGTI
jgi:hypothetical protein